MTDESEFDAHFEYIVQYVEAHPYLSWIGVRPLDVEHGCLRLTVPYSERLVNPDQAGGNGVIHGGILATVLDHVSGMSLRTTLDNPEAVTQVTTDLHVSYLRPATNDLYATGEVVRAGKTLGVVRSVVESDAPGGERKTVAIGQASFRRYLENGVE